MSLLVSRSDQVVLEDVPGVSDGETLTAVREFVRILNNDNLVSLSPGLDHLQTVGLNCVGSADTCAGFDIQNNPSLGSLPSFDELVLVNSSLSVVSNDDLAAIDGFDFLGTISGALRIQSNNELTSVKVRHEVLSLVFWVFCYKSGALFRRRGWGVLAVTAARGKSSHRY